MRRTVYGRVRGRKNLTQESLEKLIGGLNFDSSTKFLDIDSNMKGNTRLLETCFFFVNTSCKNIKFFSISTPENEIVFNPYLMQYV